MVIYPLNSMELHFQGWNQHSWCPKKHHSEGFMGQQAQLNDDLRIALRRPLAFAEHLPSTRQLDIWVRRFSKVKDTTKRHTSNIRFPA